MLLQPFLSGLRHDFLSWHQWWILVQGPWMGTESDGKIEPPVCVGIGYRGLFKQAPHRGVWEGK